MYGYAVRHFVELGTEVTKYEALRSNSKLYYHAGARV